MLILFIKVLFVLVTVEITWVDYVTLEVYKKGLYMRFVSCSRLLGLSRIMFYYARQNNLREF
jgi:hypothetical protein